jgi:hypothetical protein
MPTIQIQVRLIHIGKPLARGEWMLLRDDDTYDVLTHTDAMKLQGRRSHHKVEPTTFVTNASPERKSFIRPKHTLTVNGKTVHVQRKLVETLQLVDANGGTATVKDTGQGHGMSACKALGLLEVKGNAMPFLYALTNEGRAVIAAANGTELPGVN